MSTQKHAPFAGSGITRPERKKMEKKSLTENVVKLEFTLSDGLMLETLCFKMSWP